MPHTLKGTVGVTPSPVRVRDDITVQLAGWNPNNPLSITMDGAPVAIVTTDSVGAATLTVTIAKKATVGTHTITATAADGTSTSADFLVTKKNVKP